MVDTADYDGPSESVRWHPDFDVSGRLDVASMTSEAAERDTYPAANDFPTTDQNLPFGRRMTGNLTSSCKRLRTGKADSCTSSTGGCAGSSHGGASSSGRVAVPDSVPSAGEIRSA